MSLTYNQIISGIERECGFKRGQILDNPERKQEFTEDINMAQDDIFSIAFKSSGAWQVDDITHPKYPILNTNLVAGQRDYSFTKDVEGNLILDFYKIMIALPDGTFKTIDPVDRNEHFGNLDSFETNKQGIPTRYDKLANGIFLDLIPSYSIEDGLRVFVNREGMHYQISDTDKLAGFDGRLHEYLILKPSYKYSRRKGLSNVARLERDILIMEENARQIYASRERDTVKKMEVIIENNQ